jgi:hypothetical protein
MNANCPACDKPLRNPRLCGCGWELEKPTDTPLKPVSSEQFERNKLQAHRFKMLAERLANNEPYEPGSDIDE